MNFTLIVHRQQDVMFFAALTGQDEGLGKATLPTKPIVVDIFRNLKFERLDSP